MVLDRGAWVAVAMLSGLAAGCDSAPLATPHPVDTGIAPQSLVIPDDVVAPVLSCTDGSTHALNLPCQLGLGPVFETDCSFGTDGNQIIRFMLPESLPDAGNSLVSGPPLGTPERFHAKFVPPTAAISMDGTVTFTKGSLTDRTLDGWFTHLDVVSGSGAGTVSCTLDEGRFTTVPGSYL
jgi:hypothetical protein